MGNLSDRVQLNNGVWMPRIGLGTAGITDPAVIEKAARIGYRNFDTATDYVNENVVGKGLKNSGLDRSELFITTKVWNSKHGYEKTLRAFEYSCKELQTEYIDLYLIHWPCPDFGLYIDTWKTMEKLYNEGRIRAIGLANFYREWIQDILDNCEVVPAVDQLEYNPYHQHTELRAYCESKGIQIEGYTPIVRGAVNNDPAIREIGEKYGKTGVQVTIRFLYQDGIILIPRTRSFERLKTNVDIFDFVLTEEEMNIMRSLNKEKIQCGEDPYRFHETFDRVIPINADHK